MPYTRDDFHRMSDDQLAEWHSTVTRIDQLQRELTNERERSRVLQLDVERLTHERDQGAADHRAAIAEATTLLGLSQQMLAIRRQTILTATTLLLCVFREIYACSSIEQALNNNAPLDDMMDQAVKAVMAMQDAVQ